MLFNSVILLHLAATPLKTNSKLEFHAAGVKVTSFSNCRNDMIQCITETLSNISTILSSPNIKLSKSDAILCEKKCKNIYPLINKFSFSHLCSIRKFSYPPTSRAIKIVCPHSPSRRRCHLE